MNPLSRTHPHCQPTVRPRERGFAASVIVLALLTVLMLLVMGNSRVLHSLQRELRQVEQRQLLRTAADRTPEAVPGPAASPGAGIPGAFRGLRGGTLGAHSRGHEVHLRGSGGDD